MTPKLLLHLLSRRNSQGFAIAFALALGAVMVLVGVSLMVRSTRGRTDAVAHQNATSGLGLAEVGVTRFHDLLNRNRYIALYNDCNTGRNSSGVCQDSTSAESWAKMTTLPKINACQANDAAKIESVAYDSDWVTIKQKGQYRLIRYQFQASDALKPHNAPGRGILTLEGRIKQNNDFQVATSRLEVEIPIEEGSPAGEAIPGLWTTNGTISNNKVQGDVLLNDCNVSQATLDQLNATKIVDAGGNDYSIDYTAMQFPDLPTKPTATAVNLGNLGEEDMLYLPSQSTTDDFGLPITKKTWIFPRKDSTNTTLIDTPRTVTLKDGSTVQVYEYILDHINLNNHVVKITPGKRVTFYLRGDIDKGTQIDHSCTDASGNPIANCKPTDFQIYGYGEIAPLDGTAHKICLNGNRVMESFIFAPDYKVGVAGVGGGGGFKGSVWAKTWSDDSGCGSNTNNIVVTQTGTWDELAGLKPKNVPPKISNISNWNRLERE